MLGNPIYKLVSKESLQEIKSHHVLEICIGARVMLLKNLYTSRGLVNGSMGVVEDIVFNENQDEPDFILVNFFSYTGAKVIEETNAVPITLSSFMMTMNKKNEHGQIIQIQWSRRRFPLRLCYGLTIHKSQSLTLPKAVIDIQGISFLFKQKVFILFFVAVSRVKRFNDLLFMHEIQNDMITCQNEGMVKNRIDEELRLYTLFKNTLTRYGYSLSREFWERGG